MNRIDHSPIDIANAYLREAALTVNGGRELGWATSFVMDLPLEQSWEHLWTILLAIVRREEEIDTDRLAYISAGPLEDLICKAGPEFIDRIEHEAKFNRQFGKLLTGVWLSHAEPEVRDRVLKFCRAFPDPIDGDYRY